MGANLLTLGYTFSSGEVLFDKTIPIEDATGDIHTIVSAYSRSLGVFGMAGRADVALPFVTGRWEGILGQAGEATALTGFADPVLRFALFVIGAPALTPKQFATFKPRTVVGATLRITVPLGQYDSEKLINLGSHRWSFSPHLSVSHLAGKYFIEVYASGWFFTDNGSFLGTRTLSQNPLFTFQGHVGYRFRRGFWLAVSSRQSLGGATYVNDGDRTAAEANNRVGLTLAYPLSPQYGLRFSATTGLTATVGNDYSTLALAWQVVL